MVTIEVTDTRTVPRGHDIQGFLPYRNIHADQSFDSTETPVNVPSGADQSVLSRIQPDIEKEEELICVNLRHPR